MLLFLNAGVKQFFDPAHDSLIPELANDEELAGANSFLSIASFGSTAIGFAGAGLLASTVDLTWAFIIDAASFVVCAFLISTMGRYPMPKPEEEASVAVIVTNLRSGIATLFGTPILRSLFLVGAFMFFSFGLWNVLLLPFSIRELHATEFEYGLQEGLTSVGFVVGSFFMARFSNRLPEPLWLVVGLVGMGGGRHPLRPVDVDPAGDRAGDDHRLLQLAGVGRPLGAAPTPHAPRDARARVLGVLCHARHHLPDRDGRGRPRRRGRYPPAHRRGLVPPVRLAAFALVAPVLGWPRCAQREHACANRKTPRRSRARRSVPRRHRTSAASPSRFPSFAGLADDQRDAFLRDARIRDVPAGTRVVEHGDVASAAYFILEGQATAGIPEEGGYRGLSTMGAGDFFGEIAALTGSPRTADVVADTNLTVVEVPAEFAAGDDGGAGDPEGSCFRR